MSLKSIRESYSKFLTTLNDSGISLNESQKDGVDNFILALESTMSKQRKSAIMKTKAATEAKCEKEFKQIFESILSKIMENNEYAAKIQNLNSRLEECKKISSKVDDFLNLYVESVLPKKTIVDYDRMQKLEKIHESLKDALVASEDAVEAKKAQLDESFKSEKSKCETEVAKIQVKLDESMKKNAQLQKKLDELKAVELLESKTKDLPTFEARAVKKRLCEASAPEIEKNFDKTLESVRDEVKKVATEAETSLDEEINAIVHEDDVQEDDILKNREHNLHVSESEIETESETEDDESSNEESATNECGELEEDFETMECIKFDENGDIELDDSDVIGEAEMKYWCNRAVEVK